MIYSFAAKCSGPAFQALAARIHCQNLVTVAYSADHSLGRPKAGAIR